MKANEETEVESNTEAKEYYTFDIDESLIEAV